MILYLKLKKHIETIREVFNLVEFAVDTFTQILKMALPIAIVFELGNIVVGTFMRVAFGGRLWFGK